MGCYNLENGGNFNKDVDREQYNNFYAAGGNGADIASCYATAGRAEYNNNQISKPIVARRTSVD